MDNVEVLYPLTPMQQGMLFHSVSAPESETFCQQLSCTLEGVLDAEAFRRSWDEVIDHHAILRTFFVWEGTKEPVQVVQRQVDSPVTFLDWSAETPEAQRERLEGFLVEDRSKGFDLSSPPLTRVAVVRTGPDHHQMIWSHHHILLDGTSVHRVIRDVFSSYEARVAGQGSTLSATRPFREYIRWLREQDLETAQGYWEELLSGHAASTPLSERVGTAAGSTSTAVQGITLSLPTDVYPKLVEVARAGAVTVNTVFQGAWALLLSRYRDNDDVVFGATVSGRPHDLEGADDMVGIFINTLPVRTQVAPESKLLPWLADLQRQQARSRQFEYTPLYKIQSWSDLPGGVPLFDSILAFANYRVESEAWKRDGTLSVGRFRPWESSNYPLNAYVEPGPECTLGLVFQSAMFSEDSARRLLEHWAELLAECAANPDRTLGQLSMLTEAERDRILVEWNRTELPLSLERQTHQLVADAAATAPDRRAVADDVRSLTYGELDREADQLARHLVSLGVGRGDFVAVLMERSVDLVVAVYAVLKAGGAYVPLDVEYPTERLRFMISDSGARALLTKEKLSESAPTDGSDAMVVLVDAQATEIAATPLDTVLPEVGSEDLAYVIYTSGSTGLPKGTLIRHSSLLNLSTWHRNAYGVSADDRATQVAGPAFDAFGWEVWPYLTCGASVSVVPTAAIKAPEDLRDWLVAEQITISFLPTPLAERVLTLDWPTEVALRRLLTGGDRLHQHPRRGLPFQLTNNYGPTENTVVSTYCDLEPSDDSGDVPPIGRPVANSQVYVLDRHMRPVPVGVPGELHVGGRSLALGYLNRPDLTAERFVPDPFSARPDARLYKTGDLVRCRPDGNVEFLGRIDFQVKVRGYRIELGEIEGVLVQHPGVSEAVVLARADRDGDAQLAAYVVRAEAEPEVVELRDWMKARLPAYMVPPHIIWMDGLPITPNGKVDRKALPEVGGERPDLGMDFVAPESDVERTIAAVWCEVLGVDRAGLHDNFFDLGGHSLLLTKVFGKIKGSFGSTLAMVDLFTYPTIASLATYVMGEAEADGGAKRGVDRAAVRRSLRRAPRRRSDRSSSNEERTS